MMYNQRNDKGVTSKASNVPSLMFRPLRRRSCQRYSHEIQNFRIFAIRKLELFEITFVHSNFKSTWFDDSHDSILVSNHAHTPSNKIFKGKIWLQLLKVFF